MPSLNVDQRDLEVATLAIYGMDPEHAPNSVWVDHWDEDSSFVRATFHAEFCTTCARKLLKLVAALRIMSDNEPEVTVCVYPGKTPDDLAEQRHEFVQNRLAGFNR